MKIVIRIFLIPLLFFFFHTFSFSQECREGNCQNGQGTFNFSNDQEYTGEWKNGKRHGQGTYTFSNGQKYVGEWKNGKKHGQGTYTLFHGHEYVGEWNDDKKHGQGTL